MQYHAKEVKEFVESSCSLPQDTEMQCDYNVKGKKIYSIITIYFYINSDTADMKYGEKKDKSQIKNRENDYNVPMKGKNL